MRGYRKLILFYTLILLLLFVIANTVYQSIENSTKSNHYYKVEINRALASLSNSSQALPDLSSYSTLTDVELLPEQATDSELSYFYRPSAEAYTFVEQDGQVYRFSYRSRSSEQWAVILINGVLVISGILGYGLLLALYLYVIRPFERIKAFPEELSRGVLAAQLPQQKNRLFRRFIQTLNLLKDNLEAQKEKELLLQKEKQTLVLSISHDIKTPLSAIKLYSKALSEHLYDDEERKQEAAIKINEKADEVSKSVDAIIKTSTEDFLDFTVNNGEFYIKELIGKVTYYYSHRLETAHTRFTVASYENCLVQGDFNRMCEVTDNFMENAIKYGDGKEISITISYEENCVLLTVKNSGCKLQPEEITHIFDCFKRGSNSDHIQGSGLGLYIARKLCSLMGGEAFAKVENGYFMVTAVMKKAG